MAKSRRRPYTAHEAEVGKKWRAAYAEQHGVSYAKHWRRQHIGVAYSTTMRYGYLVTNARIRGISVSLTLEQYAGLVAEPCYYCGGNLPHRGHGMDRIDSTIGYALRNVRPCCSRCNRAKGSMAEADFKNWVQQVAEHWLGRH
jgi:hypothetical protein